MSMNKKPASQSAWRQNISGDIALALLARKRTLASPKNLALGERTPPEAAVRAETFPAVMKQKYTDGGFNKEPAINLSLENPFPKGLRAAGGEFEIDDREQGNCD